MTARWRKARHLAEVSSGEDRDVILPLDDERQRQPIAFVGSASIIWRSLPSADALAQSEDELVAAIAAELAIEPAAIAADVATFLAEVRELGLLDGQLDEPN